MGVTSDKERIHRWITQADLERMLSDAYQKGAEAMRDAAIAAVAMHGTCADDVRRVPVPKGKP